jgi:hypothetical protein
MVSFIPPDPLTGHHGIGVPVQPGHERLEPRRQCAGSALRCPERGSSMNGFVVFVATE